jgi:hypothetical protein
LIPEMRLVRSPLNILYVFLFCTGAQNRRVMTKPRLCFMLPPSLFNFKSAWWFWISFGMGLVQWYSGQNMTQPIIIICISLTRCWNRLSSVWGTMLQTGRIRVWVSMG